MNAGVPDNNIPQTHGTANDGLSANGAAAEASAADGKAILTVSELSFGYSKSAGARRVLDGVSLAATLGEFACVLGPNGCGKTTLLKCIIGLLSPDSGRIAIDGRSPGDYTPRELARMISYVPQATAIVGDFSAGEVVRMGRSPHMGLLGMAGQLDMRVCRAAMDMTDTLALAERRFGSLSGGEKQTVMIARALAQQPRVMLLDEPTSSLDLRHQMEIYAMMRRLASDWGIAVICISHDVNLAARFADRLVMLSGGRVAADGTPAAVVNKDTLERVYNVGVRLIDTGDPAPLVLAEAAVRQ